MVHRFIYFSCLLHPFYECPPSSPFHPSAMFLPMILLLILPRFCLSSLRSAVDTSTLPSLSPPAGNSIQIQAKAVGGIYLYRCQSNQWIPASASAKLGDITNPTSLIGNYSFVSRQRQPRYVGTWTLFNSDGDVAESGSPVSLVSGQRIASISTRQHRLPQFLAEASFHKYPGAAASISYIALLHTNGGMPPENGGCTENAITKTPFGGDFYLWRQDVMPPGVPPQLQLGSKQRPVEGFFGEGSATYAWNGSSWRERQMSATLYDLPGGDKVGTYFVEAKADSKGGTYWWNISNPNGFLIVGKHACNPLQVDPSSLPWSLFAVTSSLGNTSLLGPYSYVQMVSTSGGLPPKGSTFVNGKVCRSYFTSIFWLYCQS